MVTADVLALWRLMADGATPVIAVVYSSNPVIQGGLAVLCLDAGWFIQYSNDCTVRGVTVLPRRAMATRLAASKLRSQS